MGKRKFFFHDGVEVFDSDFRHGSALTWVAGALTVIYVYVNVNAWPSQTCPNMQGHSLRDPPQARLATPAPPALENDDGGKSTYGRPRYPSR